MASAAHNRPAAADSQPPAREGDAIRGEFSIERITYANEETGYAVVRLVPADAAEHEGFAAVGTLRRPRAGGCYRIEGVWQRDPRFGLQVRISSAMPATPHSLAAIERYLAGASIKGLGPHYAAALIAHFGERTFDVLQRGGRELEEVPGIGPVRAATIRESWAEHEGLHALMIQLQGEAGMTPHQAQQVYQEFGLEAWAVVSQDPYRLAERVRGFGFKTCDRIGRALGLAADAPQRLQAGIIHLLGQALDEGHLWTEPGSATAAAVELLGVPAERVAPQIETLVGQERLARRVVEDDPRREGLYLPAVDRAEERVALQLAARLRAPAHPGLRLAAGRAAGLVARKAAAGLTQEQQGAVQRLLMGAPIVVLTGGPGTGKTTTVRALIACLEALHVTYALCATTGRAAKQLAASTDHPAFTVHRHLGIGGNPREREYAREAVLIIDEASMIDLWLFEEILLRLRQDTHLVLVGDVDQLPPVGPGAILADLIAAHGQGAEGLAVTRLQRIFRQEAGDRSLIVVNCHRVRAGERPVPNTAPDSDYFEMLRESPEAARDLAVELAAERLPRFLNVPPSEVQVLAPMHGGAAGIRNLNEALQAALNPPDPARGELILEGVGRYAGQGRTLREGDKVRQTRNDYQKQVYNGDLGIITRISAAEQRVTVHFDDHAAVYTFDELDALVHAWAMTVHSAQGSQWPAVVIIMLRNHYVMLERNILYTALSRARQLAVLVTQEQALRIAVAEDRATRRRTDLVRRLLRAPAGPPAPTAHPGGRLL